MRVYIASSGASEELDELIGAAIEAEGHACFLPHRDIDRHHSAARRAKAHTAAITDADLVLLLGPDIDSDVAWRAGYARALGKRIVLLCAQYEQVCDHLHMADEIAGLGAWDDIPADVADILARAASASRTACAAEWKAHPCGGHSTLTALPT